MIFPNSWGSPEWMVPALILFGIGALVVGWGYARSELSLGWKLALAGLKLGAFALLGICLLEPQSQFEQVEPGSNLMIVLADGSQSLQIKDRNQSTTRLQLLQDSLDSEGWLADLDEQFDVRKYIFGTQLKPVGDFQGLEAEEQGTAISECLQRVAERYRDRPVAGIILLTDGNATDWDADADWSQLPPVYPVVIGKSAPAKDIGLTGVTSSQTNFESAPVTISAEAVTHGYANKTVLARLVSGKGEEIQRREIKNVKDETPFAVRFQLKPEDRGVSFYQVELSSLDDEEQENEATKLNNSRNIVVDRGRGPFRVLYVTGRPNWEYKFLRRAIADDHEVELVGMVRLAKKEPKFSFRGRDGESTNPLFRGFGNEDDQTAEQYDEPVIIRLDFDSEQELRDGFPKDEETLFAYDAVIIDDLEAEFFSQDQKSLLQQFVSRRGGGLLMLGGQESFGQGAYDRTAIGEILPVYLDRDGPSQLNQKFQLQLTREGWIQPWVRVNSTESAERRRLAEMPNFQTINASRSIKPGASVLATVRTEFGEELPALVVQKYGKGKTSAMLIGDLWRWQMETEPGNDDLKKSWRQTLRWLVSEVPRRVEVDVEPQDEGSRTVSIRIDVHDEAYRPYDNADVKLTVTTPDNNQIEISPEVSTERRGSYLASFVAQAAGPYRVTADVRDIDGSELETRESGWVAEFNGAEFERLTPNTSLMETVAEKTDGEVVRLAKIGSFARNLKNKKVAIMTTRTEPWWHQWSVFGFAIGLLVCEWGIRRWKGMA